MKLTNFPTRLFATGVNRDIERLGQAMGLLLLTLNFKVENLDNQYHNRVVYKHHVCFISTLCAECPTCISLVYPSLKFDTHGQLSFPHQGPEMWNELPWKVRLSNTINSLKGQSFIHISYLSSTSKCDVSIHCARHICVCMKFSVCFLFKLSFAL